MVAIRRGSVAHAEHAPEEGYGQAVERVFPEKLPASESWPSSHFAQHLFRQLLVASLGMPASRYMAMASVNNWRVCWAGPTGSGP